jgi:hypothetical protein
MSKTSKYLLTTEVQFEKENKAKILDAWGKLICPQINLYLSENEESLLELYAIQSIFELAEFFKENRIDNLKSNISKLLKSDLHQEILTYKEDIVPQEKLLPTGSYIQLRHIEVPLNVYDKYLDWRSKTIFEHVKKLPTVNSFVAYHSLLSMQPGVMFVSSFSCEIGKYLAGFNNPAYQDIIKQAGDRFIAGGKNGLYTKIYKKFNG